ncbi:MAG: hypothetical protein J6Y13_06805, partial [Treponema sp.]|nr:hypothetical protein [Treponema sp.]
MKVHATRHDTLRHTHNRLFRVIHSFFPALSAVLLAALIACTGNGGAANSGGEVYIPGDSSWGGNSGTTSSGGST